MVKKHTLDCSNELWKKVMIYRVQGGFNNVNDALIDLLEKALAPRDNYQELAKKSSPGKGLTDKHKEKVREEFRRKFA